MSWLRVGAPLLTGQLLDSVQGLRLSRAFRLCGCGAAGGWGLGPGDGEAEGAGEAAAAADMCGGGEGGESLSSPDIGMERKYSTVQYSAVQYSTVPGTRTGGTAATPGRTRPPLAGHCICEIEQKGH